MRVGDAGPDGPTQQMYQKQLQDNISHFNDALHKLQVSKDRTQQAHLQDVMRQQMAEINQNIAGIKRSGIEKQGKTVQDDLERYLNNPTSENFTTLEQVTSTLKEYSELPLTQNNNIGIENKNPLP